MTKRAGVRPELVLPPDLLAALAEDGEAAAMFDRLSHTHRREHVEALLDAKKPETRTRRLEKTMAMLRSGRASLSNSVSKRPAVAKMRILPGQRVLVLGADPVAMRVFEHLPDGCVVDQASGKGAADVVVLFAADAAALKRLLPGAIKAGAGALWIAFPKLTSGRATTLTRDVGWEPVQRLGLQFLTLISLDDIWSAVRYRVPPLHPDGS